MFLEVLAIFWYTLHDQPTLTSDFMAGASNFLSVLAKWYSNSHRIFWDFLWIYANFKDIFLFWASQKIQKWSKHDEKNFLICARPCFIQHILNQVPTTSRTFSYKNMCHHYVFLVGKIWFLNNLVYISFWRGIVRGFLAISDAFFDDFPPPHTHTACWRESYIKKHLCNQGSLKNKVGIRLGVSRKLNSSKPILVA